jgi:glycosyltransferase involved in cell wall biosynthesis
MRVLHVMPSIELNTGGVNRSVPALCGSLQAADVDVALYTFRRSGVPLVARPEDLPIQIEAFAPFPGSRELPSVAFWRRLSLDLPTFDLAHLHAVWNPMVSLAALLCRRLGVPYVLSPRGMLRTEAVGRKRGRKELYYRLCENRTIAGAALLHFLTHAEALSSKRFVRAGQDYSVVPNGIDPTLAGRVPRGRFRKAHAGLDGRPIMLFLGRLHPVKNLDLQAEALAILVREIPDLTWVLAGPDNGEWGRIARKARNMGLERHVLWTGLLSPEQCLEALADADVFVLTSHHEAHSMAMNEALAMRTPVVIAEGLGFDMVQESGAAAVVSRSPRSLAAAVADILRHPARAGELREAGSRLVTQHLAWPAVASRMVQAYQGVFSATGEWHGAATCCI